MICIDFLIWATGAYIIFIRNKENRKPYFITAIWILILLQIMTRSARSFIAYWYNKGHHTDALEFANPEIAFGTSNITSTIHWLFAVEYFELALKFEMVLGNIKTDIER